MITYIYYAHLASVRFEHSVCRGSLMTTYINIYIYIERERERDRERDRERETEKLVH